MAFEFLIRLSHQIVMTKPELVAHRFRDGFQEVLPVHDSFHLCDNVFHGLQYGPYRAEIQAET